MNTNKHSKLEMLVSADWLNQHLDDEGLVILDCSVNTVMEDGGGYHNESGFETYQQGHIPGAGFADLTDQLCDSHLDIEFAMPDAEAFCTAMGKLGVGDNSSVVLYDRFFSAWAARVWWMLRWVGFDRAAILDGGLNAWLAGGRPLITGTVSRSVQKLTPELRPELIADKKEVLSAINSEKVQIIDTLPDIYYRGEQSLYARPGHIPGAVNISALNLLDESGCYLPLDTLEALHSGNKNARNITYCGGGIAASSNAFTMLRLGYTDVAVYTASLQEWAADPEAPMEVSA